MKIKHAVSLIAIMTSMALSPVTWAAGRGGGGGGGGGGHFGGGGHYGGFRGGGFRGSGYGGRHFVAGGYRGGSHFGSNPRFASRPGFSSMRQPSFAGSNRGQVVNRSASSRIARNRGSTGVTGRPIVGRGINGRTDHIFARHDGNWHRDWDHHHSHFHNGHFFVFDNGFWWGLDAGYYPWDYFPYYADDYYPYDYYTDAQSGDTGGAIYNGVPVADETVRGVQTQLAQAGYYSGPVDGIYGAGTRDAVAKYQAAKQLPVTGSLSADTLRSLGLSPATAAGES